MRLRNFLPYVAFAASSVPAAYAWGAAGHEIVATIAQMYLHPSVLPTLCEILAFESSDPNAPQCHLAPIAAWADKIRWRARWSGPMHYVGGKGDHPSQTCKFPGPEGWAGRENINVLGALRNDTGILQEWVEDTRAGRFADDDRANEALKFLVHFMGDMHQPLHLTGRDRGGNSAQVQFDGRHTNLHSLWDGLLIAKAIRQLPHNYTRPLPVPGIELNLRGAIYDPYIRRIVWKGLLQDWKLEVNSWLDCPKPEDKLNSAMMWSDALVSPLRVMFNPLERLWRQFTTVPAVGGETDDESFCPFAWAQPIHELNCDIIWPPKLDEPPYGHSSSVHEDGHEHDHSLSIEEELAQFSIDGTFIGGEYLGGHKDYLELDTPEYAGKIIEQELLERLLAQGGIRLAGLLNYVFAHEEESGLHLSMPEFEF